MGEDIKKKSICSKLRLWHHDEGHFIAIQMDEFHLRKNK